MMPRRGLSTSDLARGAPSGALGDADWDYVWDDVWDAAEPRPPSTIRRRRPVRWGTWAICWTGLALVTLGGSYAGSAWLAADGMLHALGRRDIDYMTKHLDAARLLAGLERDLRHLAAQSVRARGGGPQATESTYLNRMAHGTATALNDPAMLGLVVQARLFDSISGSELLDTIDNGPRHIVADGLTAFHVAFDADSRSVSGITLCFTLEHPTRLDWRLVQIAWPELGGSCGRG